MVSPIAFLLVALIGAQDDGSPPPTTLAVDTLPAWRAWFAPRAGEDDWRAVGWETTFGDGLRRGQELDRPILLWAMNGHPLGNT